MGKVETRPVDMVAEGGAVVTVNVPVGDIVEPSSEMTARVNDHFDRANWKFPLREFVTYDRDLAVEYAAAVDFYVGGHEFQTHYVGAVPGVRLPTPVYVVKSLGYYHYCGC